MEVGNVVRSKTSTTVAFGGVEVPVPAFLAKAFNLKEGENSEDTPRTINIDDLAMDEECYLGKDGDLEDCADFDPMH